jgi:hypothetical protein
VTESQGVTDLGVVLTGAEAELENSPQGCQPFGKRIGSPIAHVLREETRVVPTGGTRQKVRLIEGRDDE